MTIPAALLAAAGTAQITATNSSGIPSASLPFIISPLTISSLSPANAPPGGGAISLTVNGQFFNSGAVVQWTGPAGTVPIAPVAIQAGQLTATIPASLLSTAGTAQIAISQPGSTLSNSLAFTIDTPIVITTTTLPSGLTSTPYSATLMASGGAPPYSNWILTSGSLPQGLTLNSSTGVINGTPSSTTGIFVFTLTVKDSVGEVSNAQIELVILNPTSITLTGPAKSPTFGQPVTLTATVTPSNAAGKVTSSMTGQLCSESVP